MLSERDRVVALTEVLTGPAGAEIRAKASRSSRVNVAGIARSYARSTR